MAPVCRMLELFRAKEKPEEEKVVKKEDGPSTPSPAKRMATDMEKKLKNMPGDVSLVKEILDYVMGFTSDGNLDCAHPCQAVLDCLCSDNAATYAGQLEAFFGSYADMRGNRAKMFKPSSSMAIDASSCDDTLKLPLTLLKYDVPEDGLPSIDDWLVAFTSILLDGLELQREPLDVSVTDFQPDGSGNMSLQPFSVDVVKGWTRCSCVAFIALAVSDLDPTDEDVQAVLMPLHRVLDKAWLLPMHIALNMNKDEQSFRNISLSFRGSERQAPTVLQMALRFSKVMERQAAAMTGNTESRLKKVVSQFNSTPGLHVKHQVDYDKERTILNLIIGTCKEARDKMMNHLAFTKWKDSAFSSEQLRTTRWLLGAKPKGMPDALAEILTVGPVGQAMLIDLHVKSFQEATRRLKVSAWCRKRASPEEFDKYVDFACVFAFLRAEARKTTSDPSVDSKLIEAFMSKDYFADIEAVTATKSPQFRVQSLAVWADIIAPPMIPTSLQGDAGADVLAAQEQATASKFSEVKIRLAADAHAMNQYNLELNKNAGKQHVAKVLHEKAQLATGKKVVDEFMQNHCWVGLVGDMEMPAEVDIILRATAVRAQVSTDKVNVIGWMDLTKLGVLGQKDVNRIGAWCEKLISKRPTGTVIVMALPLLTSTVSCGALRNDIRKLEDKLLNHRIEFRSFFLPMDLGQLHHNREMPAGFTLYLCVSDCTLPAKGTAHPANRNAGKVDPADVNVFCSSQLWREQLLPTVCRPLEESEFVIPGCAQSSAEGRRNYTDVQETAQWLGGSQIPSAILASLTSGIGDSTPTMLANATLYDGCVEMACIKMGITCCSQTDRQAPFNTGLQLVKSHLLDMWKAREGAMQNKIPKYQAEPNQCDLPTGPAAPEFKLCSLVDGCLVLPRDVRTEFLTDPVRGPEWRKIVGEFDRCFAVAASADGADAGPQASGEPANQQQAGFSWESIFADEPRDRASWHQKYDGHVKGKCQWCPQLTAYLVTSPSAAGQDETPRYMLFVEASEDYTIPKDDVFLAYGAGTWLLDGKADAYIEENNDYFKGVLCQFTSDVALVVLEESGTDGPVKTLREIIQQCETAGLVDFELAGHTYTRPPAVVQGVSTDQFDIQPKSGSKMIWRPNQLQLTGLRATNIASFFMSQDLDSCATLDKVWRMRAYRTEKTVGAAKPLWYLKAALQLSKDTVQRFI